MNFGQSPSDKESLPQLQSASFYNGNFYLQNGGNILRYNESGDLQETISSGWDNVVVPVLEQLIRTGMYNQTLVQRLSAQVVRLTLPVIPGYDVPDDEQ